MRRVVAVLAITLLTAACTIMNNLHLDQAQQPVGDDDDDDSVGLDASKDGSPVGPDGAPLCVLRRPPGPPKPVAGGTDISITVAMRNMLSDTTGPRIGLDQDGICTCMNGAPEACKVKSNGKHCDPGTDGLDNAGGELFRAIASGPAQVNVIEEANFRVQGGGHGNVFRIDGYNGQANDDAVTVTYWPSSGINTGVDFNKVQAWPVGTPVPATKAYVAQNQLVAQFATLEIFFLDAVHTPVFMNAVTMTGEIKDSSLATALFAGRVNTTALIQGVGQIAPQALGGDFALCNSGAQYSGVASNACPQSDLPADPAKDKTGDADCTMLSMALELRFVPAMVGGPGTITRQDDHCAGETLPSCD